MSGRVTRPLATVTVAAMLASCAAPPRVAEPSPSPRAAAMAAALDARAPGWLARDSVPSIAVAYDENGRVAWTRVYGMQAPGVPATTRTLYNVASLTKPVFAELVVRLSAARRLSLDEPMASAWVDPDVAADPRHRALTPRLALSHRAGFANWRRETKDTLRFLFDPGTAYRYSGEGYEYVRRFVERKLGAPLDSLARRELFGPLGMGATAFTRQDWMAGRIAWSFGPDGAFAAPTFSARGNAADDLYTTIGDYAAFLAAVMNRDGLPGRLAVERDSVHSVDTGPGSACDPTRVARCPTRMGYGLGWSIMEYPDGPVRWHTGSDRGERAMVFYLPARREGAVLLTNGAHGFDVIIDAADLLVGETDFGGYLRAGKRR